MSKYKINISSEIGNLERVLIHTPGPEVENMTPDNAHRALYSDILNLPAVSQEYNQLKSVLEKVTQTVEVKTLLTEVLTDEGIKERLVRDICELENTNSDIPRLMDTSAESLACKLIEGLVLQKDNLSHFLSKSRYSLQPLHNFLFTRDASMSLWREILIARMASKIRKREPLILDAIFREHPLFGVQIHNPIKDSKDNTILKRGTIEGGDLQVAREDVLLIGTGTRTSAEGIDFIIELIREKKTSLKHIIVQELPKGPESFIHLDMTFTFLDYDYCMIYEPLILRKNKYQTIHIQIDNGRVTDIRVEDNLLQVLKSVGIHLKALCCGGREDPLVMEREQWHSAANFLALAPGKVIGYERNDFTLEELNRNGFEIIKAADFIKNDTTLDDFNKVVITIPGAELTRGGGGPRCLTMPLSRGEIN